MRNLIMFLAGCLLLMACGSTPAAPAQPVVVAPTDVAVGQQNPAILESIGVTKIAMVEGGGTAFLLSDDRSKVLGVITSGTSLTPTAAVLGARAAALPFQRPEALGYYFRVTVGDKTGWVFEDQVTTFEVKEPRLAIAAVPTPGPKAVPTPTLDATRAVPTFNAIGTKNPTLLSRPVVYLFETASFDSKVIGLVQPNTTVTFLAFGPQNTASPLVITRDGGAQYYSDSWFYVSVGGQRGYIHADYLNIS